MSGAISSSRPSRRSSCWRSVASGWSEVGTNWALTRRLGHRKAFELFVRGGTLPAAQALAQHAILAEEFAEPMTFSTAAHRRAIDALLAKTERAVET